MLNRGANSTEKSKKFWGPLFAAAARSRERLEKAAALVKRPLWLKKTRVLLKRPLLWLNGRPRHVKAILVYAAVLIIAGSFFFWWAFRSRLTNPYTTEPRFDWEEYKPEEEEKEPEPAPQPDPETEPEEAPEQEPVVAEPPKPVQGAWPLEGELLYRFHQPVTFPLPAGQHSFYFKGIAIQADPGTAVKAVWDGEVARVRETDFPRGASVTLLHDDGKVTVYGGLERSAVQKGDLLKQGDSVGVLAPAGDDEPAYLYLEVHADGRPVDPLNYLP
ncbi:MAG TPA: peptidoglycan DD-metalloendopeptidase family protein [Bacillota bacterium]|jgi:hypothetical protein|nr:peptidoglycan DD-metalloendopeptidase family protein [Bacillota bacterium]HOB86228.1 peptidoglycan DD-metalloendopeptidase family protein [Bacillota bacterium]HOP68201.1 peptidoglycan DD-metalloendopeptidase family protein [Bacillota bacterium]HPT33071.1 peptidoglycan DD-metalloendopeptidase family protein [Bacillota bacterium]HPZ65610.1 peptidoglycan DD-metalloendopeptidase family protein [Bacillota bacterium]